MSLKKHEFHNVNIKNFTWDRKFQTTIYRNKLGIKNRTSNVVLTRATKFKRNRIKKLNDNRGW